MSGGLVGCFDRQGACTVMMASFLFLYISPLFFLLLSPLFLSSGSAIIMTIRGHAPDEIREDEDVVGLNRWVVVRGTVTDPYHDRQQVGGGGGGDGGGDQHRDYCIEAFCMPALPYASSNWQHKESNQYRLCPTSGSNFSFIVDRESCDTCLVSLQDPQTSLRVTGLVAIGM